MTDAEGEAGSQQEPTSECAQQENTSSTSTAVPPSSSSTSSKSKKHAAGGQLPLDKVSLKLILASGKSAEFIFPLITSVGEVTEYVYDNWPEEWNEEKESITSHHVLRLIYQGRFLHENVTFTALNLSPGKRTVMHLIPREKLPQLSPDDMEKSPKSTERSCCCCIL
jgi:hypothetical protein